MKLRALTPMAGAGFVRAIGDEFDEDARAAQKMIARGFAEAVKTAKPRKRRKIVETTAAPEIGVEWAAA